MTPNSIRALKNVQYRLLMAVNAPHDPNKVFDEHEIARLDKMARAFLKIMKIFEEHGVPEAERSWTVDDYRV